LLDPAGEEMTNQPSPTKAPTAGYSGTPLAKKLGIKPGSQILVIDAPEGYLSLLDPLPSGVRFGKRLAESTEIVHIFTTRREELHEFLTTYRSKLKPTGVVWVSWPKKSAKVSTDITEDTIREVALPLDFVDVKVCAVNKVWSGLKLVIRKELR
jgi:hypothetical protein